MENTNTLHTTNAITAMYPYELALAAGVSRRTMSKWMAAHRDELAALGYATDSRLLPPSAVKFLAEFYCIDLTLVNA